MVTAYRLLLERDGRASGETYLRRERPMERASRDTPSPLDSPQRRSWPRGMAREMAMTIGRDCRSPAVHHQSQSRDGPLNPRPSLPLPPRPSGECVNPWYGDGCATDPGAAGHAHAGRVRTCR